MAVSRRQFVAAGAASIMCSSSKASQLSSSKGGQLMHCVYFWLKDPDSTKDLDALVAGLQKLKAIPTIKSLQIGLPANTEKRDVVDNSFSVFELMVFDDVAGQNAYQAHALHTQFVEEHSHLWEKVVVHDSLLV